MRDKSIMSSGGELKQEDIKGSGPMHTFPSLGQYLT